MNISNRAADAIRYYMGDVSGKDPFWSDPKAYCTMNALFFPGIVNETARSREGKRLNPSFFDDIDRLLTLYADLFRAFTECGTEKELHTCRVERLSDYLMCRDRGATISFTSTSTAGFLRQYGDKKGLAILRFTVPAGTPCIVMADVLDFYAKADEAEVLLPPCLALDYKEIPLTDEERTICDDGGNPPAVSCEVTVRTVTDPADEGAVMTREGAEAGARICRALNAGAEPDENDVLLYTEWKKAFRSAVFRELHL